MTLLLQLDYNTVAAAMSWLGYRSVFTLTRTAPHNKVPPHPHLSPDFTERSTLDAWICLKSVKQNAEHRGL
jgi:hypothetical protein